MQSPPANRLIIEPSAVYFDAELVIGLGLTHATFARARRDGQLRFARKGRRVLYLGQWVLDWLSNDGAVRGQQEAST